MASRNSKSRFRHPIAPLILASSLVGGVAACSLTSDPPAVTQLRRQKQQCRALRALLSTTTG